MSEPVNHPCSVCGKLGQLPHHLPWQHRKSGDCRPTAPDPVGEARRCAHGVMGCDCLTVLRAEYAGELRAENERLRDEAAIERARADRFAKHDAALRAERDRYRTALVQARGALRAATVEDALAIIDAALKP